MEKFALPFCSLPKPGEDVVCYTQSTKMIGQAKGYNKEGIPVIQSPTGFPFTPLDRDSIRLSNPYSRPEAAWKQLPPKAIIRTTNTDEQYLFEKLLTQKLPGNSSYFDFISEIWYRGFDVFVVGGTVRDIINGNESNDVDLVTSMPLSIVYSLATSMFGRIPNDSCKYNSGYIKIGGRTGAGDPFIDLKTFCSHGFGTEHALFGNNMTLDTSLRDFACNSIYYEPINRILIDPSGIGIKDALDMKLSIVTDKSVPNRRYQVGTIPIRFLKFYLRGFKYDEGQLQLLISEFIPELRTMKMNHRETYLINQLTGKSNMSREEAISIAQSAFIQLGLPDVWNEYFTKPKN